MFIAMFAGVYTGIIMDLFGKFTFFKEESVIPAFVRAWFDSLLPIATTVVIAWVVVNIMGVLQFKRGALLGRQKQDYLIKSALYQKIVVVGNQVQFEKLRTQLDEIVKELKRITPAEDVTRDLLAPIRTVVEIIGGFNPESK